MENKPKSLAKVRKCQLSTEGQLQPHPTPALLVIPRVWEEQERHSRGRLGWAEPSARCESRGFPARTRDGHNTNGSGISQLSGK